jgi:hypothetical protein
MNISCVNIHNPSIKKYINLQLERSSNVLWMMEIFLKITYRMRANLLPNIANLWGGGQGSIVEVLRKERHLIWAGCILTAADNTVCKFCGIQYN